jgi:hypothetical protein
MLDEGSQGGRKELACVAEGLHVTQERHLACKDSLMCMLRVYILTNPKFNAEEMTTPLGENTFLNEIIRPWRELKFTTHNPNMVASLDLSALMEGSSWFEP